MTQELERVTARALVKAKHINQFIDRFAITPTYEDLQAPVNLQGVLDTAGDLPDDGNTTGDAYLVDGIVWVWSGTEWSNQGSLTVGEQGDPATLRLMGTVATTGALPVSGNVVNDVWIVDADGHGWAWTSDHEWVDIGEFRGPQGPGGIDTDLRARVDPGTTGAAGQYATIGPSGPDWLDEMHYRVDHPRWGGDFSGGADVTSAILSAIDDAYTAAGSWYSTAQNHVVVIPPGVGNISGLIELGDLVAIRGAGGRLSTLKATHADAQIKVSGSGGQYGGFNLDGDSIANNMLLLGQSNGNTYWDMYIRYCAGAGVILDNHQNGFLMNVNCEYNGEDGFIFQNQASTNLLSRCQSSGNGNQNVWFKHTSGSIYSNVLDTCTFERRSETQDHMILCETGDNEIRSCAISNTMNPTTQDIVKVAKHASSTACTLAITGRTRISGDGTDVAAIGVTEGTVLVAPTVYISAVVDGVALRGSNAFLRGAPFWGTVTTRVSFSGGAAQTTNATTMSDGVMLRLHGFAANERVISITDGTNTFRVDSKGVQTWGADTTLERAGANVLAVGANDCLRTGRNTTANRPAASSVFSGSTFYDTTLGIPIWSNGTVWKDAAGNTV